MESPDLSALKEPEKIAPPARIVKKVTLAFPFKPVLNYYKNSIQYEYQGHSG